jgi:hypothetical protein
MPGAVSDERTGLSFTTAAGPCQCSHSLVRVPWGSPAYFAVSDSRLPFLSPSTTHSATVEVFDLASTRDKTAPPPNIPFISSWHGPHRKHISFIVACFIAAARISLPILCLEMVAVYRLTASNSYKRYNRIAVLLLQVGLMG